MKWRLMVFYNYSSIYSINYAEFYWEIIEIFRYIFLIEIKILYRIFLIYYLGK